MIESCMIVLQIFVSFHINFFIDKNVIILIIVRCTKCI